MQYYILILVLIILTGLPALWTVQSQSVGHFGTADGLPGLTTYGIAQDKAGYIWIPTNNGLCRYDGRTFKRYDSPLIKNNEIPYCKIVLNRLWCHTYADEFFYLENDSIQSFEMDDTIQAQDWIGVNDSTMLITTRAINNIRRTIIYRIYRTKQGWQQKRFDVELNGYCIGVLAKLDTQVYLFCNKILKHFQD